MNRRSRLDYLAGAGQSVWSDQISRGMLGRGELAALIEHHAVTGVTSNPSIFAAAIGGSTDYDEALRDLGANADAPDVITTLMTEDIRRTCDLLHPIWERTGGEDGHVSVEVDPMLAHETDATVLEAKEWASRVARPNLLVKVPATKEGIPAIERLVGDGISVNVTLIFSLERYREVVEAYLAGLEAHATAGGDIASVASVASFFVSRFDSEVDRRLDDIGTDEAAALRGTTAIANARAAYDDFLMAFRGERWESLAENGARVQRPLWASTSTKSPSYPDTLYVHSLVAPHTVNTMPLETIAAYQSHGPVPPRLFGPADMALARGTLRRLADVGVDYDDVVQVLEDEGVGKFVDAWHGLLRQVDERRS